MWDSDSSDGMSVDEEQLDESMELDVKARLEEPLEFPTVCPVCSASGNRSKRLKDPKALLQHAEQQAKETSAEMKKLRVFHEGLARKVKQMHEDDRGQHNQDLVGVDSMSMGEQVNGRLARRVHSMDCTRQHVRDGRALMHEMKKEKLEKKRKVTQVSSMHERFRHETWKCRVQQKIQLERKMAEIAHYEQTLAKRMEQRDEEISARHAAIEKLETNSKEKRHDLSLEERMQNSKMVIAMRKQVSEMEQSRAKIVDHLHEYHRKKAVAIAAKAVERDEVAAVQQARQDRAEFFQNQKRLAKMPITQDFKAATADFMAQVGMDQNCMLALRCRRCNTKFKPKEKQESKEEGCVRAIVLPCGCSSICQECLSGQKMCLLHGNTSVYIDCTITFSKLFC